MSEQMEAIRPRNFALNSSFVHSRIEHPLAQIVRVVRAPSTICKQVVFGSRTNAQLTVALENSFQSTTQVFCANAPSALWRLLLPPPDRTSDVELRLLKVHIGPFQSQCLSDS